METLGCYKKLRGAGITKSAAENLRHSCLPSSKQNQDQKLNEIINELKSTMVISNTDVVERIDSLQRSTAHQTSLLVEIKAKLDGLLRNG